MCIFHAAILGAEKPVVNLKIRDGKNIGKQGIIAAGEIIMSADKRLTINEIARMAQVSKGTVSKVLNNKPGIGAETRQRVMELVEHLDYHPSSVAQALANQRSNNIGLVIPHVAEQSLNAPYWSALITAIAQEAGELNYNLMLLTPKEEGNLKEIYQSVMRSKRVDGLIIGSEQIDKDSMSQLYMAKIPFVLIGQNPDFQHHFVDIDNHQAVESMMKHMEQQGYKRIGFLSGPMDYYYNRIRVNSYRQIIGEMGEEPRLASASAYDKEATEKALKTLFRNHPDMDSLFIGAGGDFLYDILSLQKEQNIPGRQLGMAVFDDYRYLDFMQPRLTAVRQPMEALGTKATHTLLDLIEGREIEQSRQILPTTLTLRSSLGEELDQLNKKN